MAMPSDPFPVAVCKYCDAAYRRPDVGAKEVAHCARCGQPLRRGYRVGLEGMLPLCLAGLLAFVVANAYPIMTLSLDGLNSRTTLWGAILAMWRTGDIPIALLVAATALVFPLLQLALRLYVLAGLRLKARLPGWLAAMHLLRLTGPWSLVEVFMVGVVIAIAKIGDLAAITPGIGAWAFGALTLLLASISLVDLDLLWEEVAAQACSAEQPAQAKPAGQTEQAA